MRPRRATSGTRWGRHRRPAGAQHHNSQSTLAAMDTDEFIARYPSLLHLAHLSSWPSIQRHGLLSTQQIVQRWAVDPGRADTLLSQRRPEPMVLEHAELGRAVLRDQHPLSEERLAPALTEGMPFRSGSGC